MIGGIEQKGNYGIDCRFNKNELIQRIVRISKYRNQIHLYNLDALILIRKIKQKSLKQNTIFYFDPPYHLKGQSLYMNHCENNDHKKVADKIKKINNAKWIVSCDDTQEIKKIYRGCKKKECSLFHTVYKMHQGKEVLFFSKNLKIPRKIQPTKIFA